MKQLNQFYSQLETLERDLDENRREQRRLESHIEAVQDEMEKFLTNNFVGLSQDETFDDHVSNVEYINGFYQSINDAIQDGADQVFNLKGDLVLKFGDNQTDKKA